MKGRSLRIFVMSIFAMLFLSGCTTAGIECGLIGKWECFITYPYDYEISEIIYTFEIRSDDKIVFRNKIKDSYEEVIADQEIEFKVKSVSNCSISCDYDFEIEYRNLTCDTVEFKLFDAPYWLDFIKVY